jgi:hypothetical protein
MKGMSFHKYVKIFASEGNGSQFDRRKYQKKILSYLPFPQGCVNIKKTLFYDLESRGDFMI